MRYGICTGIENIELVESLGYDYIEPSVTSVVYLSEEELEEKLDLVKKSSITCEAFNVLFPKTIELIGPRSNMEEVKHYLETAFRNIQILGGKVVVFGSGKSRFCPDGVDFRVAYRQLIEIVRTAGDIAKKYGLLVVIEPLNRGETNLICTMGEGAMLEADVNHENVKLLSDYYHVMTDGDPISDIYRVGSLSHIHIASSHGRYYPLSTENEKYEEFFKQLKLIGYDGRISIEGKTDNMKEDGIKALKLLKKLEEV